MENKLKCSICKSGFLYMQQKVFDKSIFFELVPFVKVSVIGYYYVCNNCESVFYKKKRGLKF